MKLAFLNNLLQTKVQHLGQPSEPSAMLTKPHLSPITMPCLIPPNQPLSSAPQMPPSLGVTCLQQPPWSSGTPSTLSLDDEEDNVKALMTFSLLQTTTSLLYVSTVPQHSKTNHQKCKTFHSKLNHMQHLPRKYSPPLEMEKQPSPMANTNGTVFRSCLMKTFGRNHQSSKVS